jgi:hypothetical protein
MRRPLEKGKGSEDVPPGGRAFQRIQQDRTARGLGKLELPGTPDAGATEPVSGRSQGKKRKKK